MKNIYQIEEVCRGLHASFPPYKERPIIGISGNFSDGNCTLADGYIRSVLAAGGSPVVIPPYDQDDALFSIIGKIDALLLTGGGDINPLYLNEEPIRTVGSINHRRDRQELLLTRLAADRQIPILGICRGIQIITAALGGELYQDICSQTTSCHIKHSQELDRSCPSHTVLLKENSLIKELFGNQEKLPVNSFHHQAVKTPPPGFVATAHAADHIIEAMESTEHKPIIGVQWHPECMILNNDTSMLPLFQWLTNEATLFRQAKELHHRMLTIDSHCDTPMHFGKNIRFDSRNPNILVDLHKMTEGCLDATVMVAYLKQLARDDRSLAEATDKANRILDEIEKMVCENHTAVSIARNSSDLYLNKQSGKKSILLGIENGYAIGKDVENIRHFRNRGVVYMTLCHNGDNDICDSAAGNEEHHGVSPFGKQVIREMNRTGMMVDLSHASEKSFYDALEISSAPIICSHSSSRSLCDHPRNLTDNQLRALASHGGIAQVCLYSGFLQQGRPATILDAIEHINHMVSVMGIEHVGIGTDFDGDGGIVGCASASELINLTRHLLRKRYTEEDIRLIWGENFIRTMDFIQNQR